MTSLQIDILSVMSYETWLTQIEIERKLKVKRDRCLWFANILPSLWSLRDQDWVEVKKEPSGAERNYIPRYYYRKVRGGRRVDSKQSFFGSLLGAN